MRNFKNCRFRGQIKVDRSIYERSGVRAPTEGPVHDRPSWQLSNKKIAIGSLCKNIHEHRSTSVSCVNKNSNFSFSEIKFRSRFARNLGDVKCFRILMACSAEGWKTACEGQKSWRKKRKSLLSIFSLSASNFYAFIRRHTTPPFLFRFPSLFFLFRRR